MAILISVVIPIYNQEKYLKDCLDSLFSQCREDVEVVLVNDGSTDRSSEICRECISSYHVNAKLIDKENSGVFNSREVGVRSASGEYILFMDSDDMLLENALNQIVERIRKFHPDMVLFNATSDLESRSPRYGIELEEDRELKGSDRYQVYKLLCCSDVLNNLWTKCIRKELFNLIPVYEGSQPLTNGEDLYQILNLADKAQSFVFINKALYYYRILPGGAARNYNPFYFPSEKIVCSKRLEFAEKWGNNGELVSGVEKQTYKILSVVSRLALLSNMSWKETKTEFRRLRSDEFYRKYFFNTRYGRDKWDTILKAPFPLLYLAGIILKKKGK